MGRKLTKELGIDGSVDTLGRWMAYYIAELIQAANTAGVEEHPVKMKACCDAILKVWKHRQSLPDGRRPLQALEPILRALASLDPENGTPRYFAEVRRGVGDFPKTEATKFWLEAVDRLDCSARILIQYCLSQAAQSALDKSVPWVSLAEAAGADDGAEFTLVRMMVQENTALTLGDRNDSETKRIKMGIKRLEEFSKLARSVVSEMRKQVQPQAVATRKKVKSARRT